MTDNTVYEDNPEWWQDGARARAFKADADYERLPAREKEDPGCLRREGVGSSTLMSLALYEQMKAGAERHNNPSPGEKR